MEELVEKLEYPPNLKPHCIALCGVDTGQKALPTTLYLGTARIGAVLV